MPQFASSLAIQSGRFFLNQARVCRRTRARWADSLGCTKSTMVRSSSSRRARIFAADTSSREPFFRPSASMYASTIRIKASNSTEAGGKSSASGGSVKAGILPISRGKHERVMKGESYRFNNLNVRPDATPQIGEVA